MEIKKLKKGPSLDNSKGLISSYSQLDKLLMELRNKELPEGIVSTINEGIDQINAVWESKKKLKKQIRTIQSNILKLIEQEHKLVTKNHYRNSLGAVGLTVFGPLLGVAFGISLGNMGFIGIGLPIGMVIGMAVGYGKDKKAFEGGRQIDLEIR